jgi:hypothetical protein
VWSHSNALDNDGHVDESDRETGTIDLLCTQTEQCKRISTLPSGIRTWEVRSQIPSGDRAQQGVTDSVCSDIGIRRPENADRVFDLDATQYDRTLTTESVDIISKTGA